MAAAKEKRRPPATTRVTRLIAKIFWSNSGRGRSALGRRALVDERPPRLLVRAGAALVSVGVFFVVSSPVVI